MQGINVRAFLKALLRRYFRNVPFKTKRGRVERNTFSEDYRMLLHSTEVQHFKTARSR